VPIDPGALSRLEDYAAGFRDVFARADQARLFGLYLRGLVFGEHRRNVESIAGYLNSEGPDGADLAQSLQHFVSQSPWDSASLIRRYRETLPQVPGDRVWVVHDGIIPKKGRHSVGVLRQYARSLGRKVSCQVAVAVTEVGQEVLPLSVRLYLPASWLREHEKTAARHIPEEARQPFSKAEIALQLLDELESHRDPAPVIAESSYAGTPLFLEGLQSRGLVHWAQPEAESLSLALDTFEWLKDGLGLSHFEGRTWIGWHHHAALVLAATGFLAREGNLTA
jgi:SRSO17 transposase